MLARIAVKHGLSRLAEDYDMSDFVSPLAKRAEETGVIADLLDENGSGLPPIAIIGILGSLAALWILSLVLGLSCKYFNKPRSAVHSGAYANSSLYRPSAATYGVRGNVNLHAQDPKRAFSSKANLLSGAQPMGHSGRPESPSDSPDVSMSRDDFESSSNQHTGRNIGQQRHHRSTSSSIGMPGPPAASRRSGPAGQQHPYLISGPSTSPDGAHFRPGHLYGEHQQSPFQPGQVYPAGPSGPRGPYSLGGSGQGAGMVRTNSKTLRGPPPARSNSNRRSRYARQSRVDSLGPGEIRRFLDEHDRDENSRRSNDAGVTNYSRRSMNGRRSQYGALQGNAEKKGKMPRSPSIYGEAELSAFKTAQAEGFGGGPEAQRHRPLGPQQGRVDPLGVSQQHQRVYATPSNQTGSGPRPQPSQMRPGGAAPPPSAWGQAPGPILQSRPPPSAAQRQAPPQQQQGRPQGPGAPGMGLRYPTGPPSHSQASSRPFQAYPQQQQGVQQQQQQQWTPAGPGALRRPPPSNAFRQPQLAQGGGIGGGGGVRQIL